MLAVIGENKDAIEATRTIIFFCLGVYILWDFDMPFSAECAGDASLEPELLSICGVEAPSCGLPDILG